MIKIEVTAEDIANGEPGESGSCPIALAFKRAIPGIVYVEVEDDTYFETNESTFDLRLPGHASQFVRDFDDGEPVKPISFEFDPDDCERYKFRSDLYRE